MWMLFDYGDLVGVYDDLDVLNADRAWLIEEANIIMRTPERPDYDSTPSISVVPVQIIDKPRYAGRDHRDYGV